MQCLEPTFNQHSGCSDAILHHSEDGEGAGRMGKGVCDLLEQD